VVWGDWHFGGSVSAFGERFDNSANTLRVAGTARSTCAPTGARRGVGRWAFGSTTWATRPMRPSMATTSRDARPT
jgi:hypothetical protein